MFNGSAQILMRNLGGVFLLIVGGSGWIGSILSVKLAGGEPDGDRKNFQHLELKQGEVLERRTSTIPFFFHKNKSGLQRQNDFCGDLISNRRSALDGVSSARASFEPMVSHPVKNAPNAHWRSQALADWSLSEQELPDPPELCLWPFFVLLFNPGLDPQSHVSDEPLQHFNALEKKALADAVALFKSQLETMLNEAASVPRREDWLMAQSLAEEHLRLTLGHDAYNRLSRVEVVASLQN